MGLHGNRLLNPPVMPPQRPSSTQTMPQSVVNVTQNDFIVRDANQFACILQIPEIQQCVQQLHQSPPQLRPMPPNPITQISRQIPPFQPSSASTDHSD